MKKKDNIFTRKLKWSKNGLLGLIMVIITINILNGLDYLTTMTALPLGAMELNPIMNHLIENDLFFFTKVLLGGAFLTYLLIRSYKKNGKITALTTGLLVVLILSIVVMNNFLVIIQLI